MFVFSLKETGETFVLPTPDDKEAVIDILPNSYSSEDDAKYMKFHIKRLFKHHKK